MRARSPLSGCSSHSYHVLWVLFSWVLRNGKLDVCRSRRSAWPIVRVLSRSVDHLLRVAFLLSAGVGLGTSRMVGMEACPTFTTARWRCRSLESSPR